MSGGQDGDDYAVVALCLLIRREAVGVGDYVEAEAADLLGQPGRVNAIGGVEAEQELRPRVLEAGRREQLFRLIRVWRLEQQIGRCVLEDVLQRVAASVQLRRVVPVDA